MIPVDLRSDTVTRPTPAMRRAMYEAEVGDDGHHDDPTVLRLQERAAELLGKPAALFMPSGTMSNLSAILAHTRRGDEVIVEAHSHTQIYERGGWAIYGGLLSQQIAGTRGVLDPAAVEAAIHPQGDLHTAGTGLICMENSHMLAGGWPVTPGETHALAEVAHRHGLPLHLDGARLFNAAVALDTPASELVAPVDSVTFCLSKGLGCPAGAILAGSVEFIQRAHALRQSFGGTLRQAGILAAAGLLAIDCHIERLADDNALARRLAEGLAEIGHGLFVDPELVATNIVYLHLSAGLSTEGFVDSLEQHGVRTLGLRPGLVRMVTHYDVDRAGIEYAIAQVAAIVAEEGGAP